MSDLTARIEALEARGVELPETLNESSLRASANELGLLTALEQAQAELSKEIDECTAWAMLYFKAQATGSARLKLAEQATRDAYDDGFAVGFEAGQIDSDADVYEALKRVNQAELALAAERAKRCDRCAKHGSCTTRVMEWDQAEDGWFFRYPPSSFSCSEYQPRKEA